jgi:hypothetical protein
LNTFSSSSVLSLPLSSILFSLQLSPDTPRNHSVDLIGSSQANPCQAESVNPVKQTLRVHNILEQERYRDDDEAREHEIMRMTTALDHPQSTHIPPVQSLTIFNYSR